MMSVDTTLQQREAKGDPIRVGMVGAGATGRAIALQLGTPVPGMRLVAIANRTPAHAERAFREAGVQEWKRVGSARDAEAAIARGVPVVADDPSVLTGCDAIDILLEVTGTVEAGASVVLDAFDHGKHVVLVNAELDSLLGPIIKARADQAGVVVTHTDGDEPGVAMTLLRYLRTTGLRPVAAGNIKGMVDYYRNPDTQRAFAEKNDQDVRKVTSFADATKLSMETTVLANGTGFHAGRRGMYGPACQDVREVANLLPADQMLDTGLVDYALGAAPHTGAFVVVYGDPTVAPIAGPVCEVVTLAKRDMKAGERLDGVGGFCAYGLIDETGAARAIDALPLSLSENCMLCRDVAKDEVISFRDVEEPTRGVVDELWSEQLARWPLAKQASRRISPM